MTSTTLALRVEDSVEHLADLSALEERVESAMLTLRQATMEEAKSISDQAFVFHTALKKRSMDVFEDQLTKAMNLVPTAGSSADSRVTPKEAA